MFKSPFADVLDQKLLNDTSIVKIGQVGQEIKGCNRKVPYCINKID
jgi:hypothetical protein